MGDSTWSFGFYKPKDTTDCKFSKPKIGSRYLVTIQTRFGRMVDIRIWNGFGWVSADPDGEVMCYSKIDDPYLGPDKFYEYKDVIKRR